MTIEEPIAQVPDQPDEILIAQFYDEDHMKACTFLAELSMLLKAACRVQISKCQSSHNPFQAVTRDYIENIISNMRLYIMTGLLCWQDASISEFFESLRL